MSTKNDGHYFCGARGNRPDGSDEALTHFTGIKINPPLYLITLYLMKTFIYPSQKKRSYNNKLQNHHA
ncbi:hypothetical protein AOY81_04545 [Escherichia coli]|nr:hypothetical protein AOY81_04545 [Escherichia coli]